MIRKFLSLFHSGESRRRQYKKPHRVMRLQVLGSRRLLSVFTPAQMRHAYGFDQIQFGTVKGDGTGQTIAIVDAYDAPKINSDLQKFNSTFGLSNYDGKGAYVLTVATPQGKPAYDAGWSQEITLDVEWAHAIAPGAHILLVEARSNSYADLMGAVDWARRQPGVSTVSMSWGGGEFSGETYYDSYFTTPAGHQGVSFFASSGDTGAQAIYPSVSPNVVSVGGTSLYLSGTAGTYSSERGWSGSGGGISGYESKPSYQTYIATPSSTKRTSPDVALDADPNTGVYVYWTSATASAGNWYSFGGTSASAPQWAALTAIADQGRAIYGRSSLDGRTQMLPALYNLPSSDFHDVTAGTTSSGGKTFYAGAGYDLVTGRGSPIANFVVRDLVNSTLVVSAANAATVSGGVSGIGARVLASPVFSMFDGMILAPTAVEGAMVATDLTTVVLAAGPLSANSAGHVANSVLEVGISSSSNGARTDLNSSVIASSFTPRPDDSPRTSGKTSVLVQDATYQDTLAKLRTIDVHRLTRVRHADRAVSPVQTALQSEIAHGDEASTPADSSNAAG